MSAPTAALLEPGAHVHLIGIGGAGMSPLAHILLARGYRVSGSDARGGDVTAALIQSGAQVHIGHAAAHQEGAQVVVVSTAVGGDNPERMAAEVRGVPVWHRADLLAALMRDEKAVLVAGTHGKTTTTSMLAVCLQHAGLDPSFAIGGALQSNGLSAAHGDGGIFVAEADESDRSFLKLTPDLSIVTNVEWDHHDAYGSLAETLEVFAQFLARGSSDAVVVLCGDDEGARQLSDEVTGPVIRYGLQAPADVRIVDVTQRPSGSSFTVVDGPDSATFTLAVPGLHNVRNATAAIIAARRLGASDAAIQEALSTFTGAQRRFQQLGVVNGVTVIDDYAHHPTELDATIAAARSAFPGARVVAAFQPHRYSRTAVLGEALGTALAAADVVVVAPVYAAGEMPLPDVDSGMVSRAAAAAGAVVTTVDDLEVLPEHLAGLVQSGDVLLTLGAGDITSVGPVFLTLQQAQGRST